MIKQFIKDTKNFLLKKPKLVRLAFLVGFCRSLSVILLLAYNINNVLIYRFDKGLSVFTVFQYFIDEITRNHIVGLVIIIAIFIAIGYIFLYPMGISATIHFLNNKKESISKAVGKGANDFFTMFELNALAFSFGPYTYLVTILRLITLDVLNSGFVIGLIILWGLIVLISSIFWQYAKFLIVEEDLGVFEAIKKSMGITVTNMGITLKGVIVKFIISCMFYFKMIIVISAPLLLIYFLISTNIIHSNNERIIRTIGIITTIIATYILSTIQAFFITFRHKIYHHILEKKD
ncbi:MAG TPA: hypothetical protein VJ892_02820 [Candidatus Absconditabacterales bacterium]|nr:hypothetical protein [Candidatus Absconditabacterales bacterium]